MFHTKDKQLKMTNDIPGIQMSFEHGKWWVRFFTLTRQQLVEIDWDQKEDAVNCARFWAKTLHLTITVLPGTQDDGERKAS